MKDDDVYMRHVLDAISRIEEYAAGIDHDGYLQNNLV